MKKIPFNARRGEPSLADDTKDLGFGARISQDSQQRLLNRDGSFNVKRAKLPFFRSLSLYHWLLTMSWTLFYSILALAYVVINLVFGCAYFLCGPGSLTGETAATAQEYFFESFFFSVQTLATIGYGSISPHGMTANVIVAVEALTGLLSVALATGLLFARFSRPTAKILFSRNAVIAPFREGTAFEFRIINERSNQLTEVAANVVYSRMEMHNGKRTRKYHPLQLEREKVMFFPLHWTIVHPIDEHSPLHGVTAAEMASEEAEVMILLSAIDETFSQAVHTRSSYRFDEIIYGAKFADMFHTSANGKLSVDVNRLHELELLDEPPIAP
jgi:inward rectifier potassium channel